MQTLNKATIRHKTFESEIETSNPKLLKLNDFDISDLLGTGSFARVKLAKEKNSNNYFAIKIMKKEDLINLGQVDHIINELKIMSIVSLQGYMQDEKYIYIVQEFINGGELFTILRAYGKMDLNMARFYSAQIVLIFEYLHPMNIIYRDLKPENVLLNRSGYIKLIDFGFSKYCEHRTYTICGTPEYLAPEILLNKGHGKSVDWWTFGVFLYELIAGYDPFSDDDPMKVYEKILVGKVKFSKSFDSNAKSLVKKCLELDLSKRYGDIANGIKKIKIHKFFKEIDFDCLLNQELKPPYIPRVKSKSDMSNFPIYPEYKKEVDANIPSTDPFLEWFK